MLQLQDDICQRLEALDGNGKFREDAWTREEGGGGRTRLIEEGALFERGGVNFSAVHGPASALMLQTLQLPARETPIDFYATGVSIVLHPRNPMVPIIHMNVRYFELSDGTYWFGGGIDLTPIYVVEEDARHFHQTLKNVCDQHDAAYYPAFKTWADDYFYIPHRQETRGIGGIFFDRLGDEGGFTKSQRFEFLKAVGHAFVPVYSAIVERRRHFEYTDEHRSWQFLRRGRYAEYNLVYDRGTKFGLYTNGRTESILMSLPPRAEWKYDHRPEEGSHEARTLGWLRKGVEWV